MIHFEIPLACLYAIVSLFYSEEKQEKKKVTTLTTLYNMLQMLCGLTQTLRFQAAICYAVRLPEMKGVSGPKVFL